jgi:putative transposase
LDEFAELLLECLSTAKLHAWCVLPNHYHLYLYTSNLTEVLAALGKLHGRTSFTWNGEENTRSRQVWHSATDRMIRTEAHGWATLNYIHHNPVRHGYTEKWQDWPWSSACVYLDAIGHEEAQRIWREFPILDYGEGWDEPGL